MVVVSPLIIKAGSNFGLFSENQPDIRTDMVLLATPDKSLLWYLVHHLFDYSFNVMSIVAIIWLSRGHIPQVFCPSAAHRVVGSADKMSSS